MLDREDVRKSGQNANDLGVRLGRSGGSYWSGRAKVHRLGEDQFARLNAKAQRRLARAMSRLQEATRRLEDSTQRLADERVARHTTETHALRRPWKYSALRGGVYVLLAILLYFADFAILAGVLSKFLGVRPSIDGSDFAQAFLNDAIGALRDNPDVATLVFGILGLGMCLKLWRDVHRSSALGPSGEAKNGPEEDRVDRLIAHVLSLAALISLVGVSLIRTKVPIEEGYDGWWVRFVSVILGVSLPLLSAWFFVAGSDNLSRAWTRRTWWIRMHVRERGNERHARKVAELQDRLDTAPTPTSASASEARLIEWLVGRYDEGYLVGLTEMVAWPGRDQPWRRTFASALMYGDSA